MPRSRYLMPVFVLVLGLALVGAAAWVSLAPRAATGVPAIGGPFTLTDETGKKVTDADFRGEPTLVFFGYTHCPDVCPTTLFDMSQVFEKLPGAKVAGLFVTVDPERDTPAVMKDYLSSFDPRIHGLSGDRAAIDPVLKEFRVFSRKVPGKDGEYTMDHSAIVYLMDKDGHFVASFNLDRKPEDSAAQLKEYL